MILQVLVSVYVTWCVYDKDHVSESDPSSYK